MLLTITILFSILGSLGALAVAGLFMLLKEDRRRGLIPYLVAFATGTLLTVALVGLIPEALEELGAKQVMQTVLIGMVAIFVLEKIFIWRHCHAGNCEKHDTGAVMICIGDAAHNFVDGVMMAAAFLTSIPMGIAVGLSAFLHEIPQEVGDFGILLHNGWSRKKAIFWNTLVGLSTVPAANAA
jgi:zinc and cadmium transporter